MFDLWKRSKQASTSTLSWHIFMWNTATGIDVCECVKWSARFLESRICQLSFPPFNCNSVAPHLRMVLVYVNNSRFNSGKQDFLFYFFFKKQTGMFFLILEQNMFTEKRARSEGFCFMFLYATRMHILLKACLFWITPSQVDKYNTSSFHLFIASSPSFNHFSRSRMSSGTSAQLKNGVNRETLRTSYKLFISQYIHV